MDPQPQPPNVETPAAWRTWTPPLAVAAALAAFFVQPLLRFVRPQLLELLALGAAMVSVGLYAALLPRQPKHNRWFWWILAFGFSWLLAYSLDLAAREAEANDRRCFAIQLDMLAAQPVRKDDPGLFQALGCQPQGAGKVFGNEVSPLEEALIPSPNSVALPEQ